ncbi:MAG: holo-ACP synthase [Bacillota bacterium]
MLVGLGLDVVEVERVRAAVARRGERLLKRLFTPTELRYCLAATEPERGRRLAARYAAKEAVRKAIGAGQRSAAWLDIEITKSRSGQPGVRLSGRLAIVARKHGVGRVLVSLTHAREYAAAQAIALGPEPETGEVLP